MPAVRAARLGAARPRRVVHSPMRSERLEQRKRRGGYAGATQQLATRELSGPRLSHGPILTNKLEAPNYEPSWRELLVTCVAAADRQPPARGR
jgi:hypothetical protein